MKNKPYNLFLDDCRIPSHVKWVDLPVCAYVLVRNYKSFVEFIKLRGVPKFISFDHDLADQHYEPNSELDYSKYTEKTGYDCAKWLINYCLDNNLEFPNYCVHSFNPVGKQNIISLIENFKNATKR